MYKKFENEKCVIELCEGVLKGKLLVSKIKVHAKNGDIAEFVISRKYKNEQMKKVKECTSTK